MAHYYTYFSFMLDVGGADNALLAAQIAANDTWREPMGDDDEFYFHAGFFVSALDGKLWISDVSGEGDVESVIEYLKFIATELNLTGKVGFTYAMTCSKPRIDGFGGGAHVMDLGTGTTVSWTDLEQWLVNEFTKPPTFWEVLAREKGWMPVPCDPSSEGDQTPHLHNEQLHRNWPLNDWKGACNDVGITEHPDHDVETWVAAVASLTTRMGYDAWVEIKLAHANLAKASRIPEPW